MLKAKKCRNKGYDKLLELFEHNNMVNQKAYDDIDSIRYATVADNCLRNQAEAEAIKKAMKQEPTYNLSLTQEEITILWGLLNDNKGNLCYSQILDKVERLRPQGGFYDTHYPKQKGKV